MRSGNPALSAQTFQNLATTAAYPGAAVRGEPMTLQGTVNKTGISLLLCVVSAAWTWNMYLTNPGVVMPFLLGGAIGGFIVAMVTVFKKTWSPLTVPIYALLEGLFLGAISAMFEQMYPGIVIQAVGLTFGTLFALLMAYKSGLIKVTENFKLGVVAATGGIALVYFASIVLGFFGISIPYIHGSGTIGIIFSLFVVVIAALNLVMDFDFIETGAEQGAPKYMEWYGAFGLLVTLIWLYLEMLRLLAKLNQRR
ncbi:MAG: Bax inhibitor-1/YccA family protein [Vicinamibacteria bacterium]